jgi:D-alanine-D-alanine ligase
VLQGRALTPIEIEPKVDFYNYENKYTAGKTEYHLPARVPDEVLEEAKTIALSSFEHLRMRSYGRIDFRLSQRNKLYFMEANTLPGCTPTSLLPKSAHHMGISFNSLVDSLIQEASLDYAGVE